MKVIDPGHVYEMAVLDGDSSRPPESLVFVKREGPGYPGNVGHHAGVQIQEVLRVLIDRLDYVNNQIPCDSNRSAREHLELAIWWLERRAAERHGRELKASWSKIEYVPTCSKCGHIECEQHNG